MASHPFIDLHLHTAVSDGTDSPAELLCVVRDAGIEIFSVTDHDAIEGCEQIGKLLRPGDPRFLFGTEFSCKDALGKYHILGYGYDPASPAIRAVTEQGRANRLQKLGIRLQLLEKDFKITFPEEDVAALYALSNPGKPHLANLMVRYGYADTISEAFSAVLNRLHAADLYVSPKQAIEGILGAGGIPVLAHPCFGDGDQLILGAELDERVRRLIGFGLKGLEGCYSGFTEPLRGQVLALARQYGLYVTAGSDYHGGNKMIPIGDTGLDAEAPFPDGLQRFLEDVHFA